MYECFAYMYEYACITCVPGACGGQKRAWDILELELWMVVSQHVGAEN